MKTQSTEVYPSVSEALSEFQCMCGFFLRGEQRKEVADLIKNNGLSRKFVKDLAVEIATEQLAA